MITIQSISYKPKDEQEQPGGYLRRLVSEVNLIEGYGVEGDRKGGHPKRNLNVMDTITLSELAAEGFPIDPGTLGENIVLSGVDLRTLSEGAQLRLGSEAVIALGKLREPCQMLSRYDEGMPESVVGRVGVMCRVVKSGQIRIGDPVLLVTEPVR